MERVKEGIRFTALIGVGYTLLAWMFVMKFPHFLFSVFYNLNQRICCLHNKSGSSKRHNVFYQPAIQLKIFLFNF